MIKIHFQEPGDLRGYYIRADQISDLLHVLKIEHFQFFRPFKSIVFTISGTQELQPFGTVFDGTIITINFTKDLSPCQQ